VGRKTIKRGPSNRLIEGKDFQLADEIRDTSAAPPNKMAAG
jgi:hypothetical protein